MREHDYSYKPKPRFFGDQDNGVFLGLELEVEAPNYQKKIEGLNFLSRPRWCYAKHDGSLDENGWEMVTHPISKTFWMSSLSVNDYLDYHNLTPGTILRTTYKNVEYTAEVHTLNRVRWNGKLYRTISACAKAITGVNQNGYKFFNLIPSELEKTNPACQFFKYVKFLRDLGYSSHDGGRCGFHIHISQSAFKHPDFNNPLVDWYERLTPQRTPMFFKFKHLIHTSDLFKKLSQRQHFDFCYCSPVSKLDFFRNGFWGRRVAVNITEKTFEVRIFRGNLREDRLRKNIEAVIAAIEYVNIHSTAFGMDDFTEIEEDCFCEYVNRNKERFPNLLDYINTVVKKPEVVSSHEDRVESSPNEGTTNFQHQPASMAVNTPF